MPDRDILLQNWKQRNFEGCGEANAYDKYHAMHVKLHDFCKRFTNAV